jgi:hypothetical protein
MKKVRWNPLKGYLLKQKYGVSFEDVIGGILIDETQHPKRDNQRIFIFEYDHYLWSIPYVVEGNGVFLKTIYPSRKLTKKYKGANNEEI